MTRQARFPGSARPPMQVYDVALLDLDGVVNVGDAAVPAATTGPGMASFTSRARSKHHFCCEGTH